MAKKRKPYVQTLDKIKAKCDEVGDCWLWNGAHDGKGRPVCVHMGERISVRRIAKQLDEGREIQAHLVVACKCGDIRCVSPSCAVITTVKKAHQMAAERGSYSNPARDRRMALAKRARSPYGADAIAIVMGAETAKQGAQLTGMSASHAKAIRRGISRRDYSNPFAGLGA